MMILQEYDRLMKVRLKGAIGNLEPLVKKSNSNSGGYSPQKNFTRANHASSDNGKRNPRVFIAVRSILSVNVMPSRL